jgi:hypothetical protein
VKDAETSPNNPGTLRTFVGKSQASTFIQQHGLRIVLAADITLGLDASRGYVEKRGDDRRRNPYPSSTPLCYVLYAVVWCGVCGVWLYVCAVLHT